VLCNNRVNVQSFTAHPRMSFGKTVKLFLADGTAAGIRHVEITNWTGQAIAAPRTRYSEVKEWEELQRPGVYFLFGYSDVTGSQLVYIGESENVSSRLGDHVKQKDFWGESVVFTSKDLNLTKAHVKYLESRIISIADDAERFDLDNNGRPSLPSLPRSDVASMEEYVELIRITLAALGYPVLEPLVARKMEPVNGSGGSAVASDVMQFTFSGQSFSARGILGDEGFIVLAGSVVSNDVTQSTPKHIQVLREAAQADGSVFEENGALKLKSDTLFKSPSAAACFVSGSSRNGKFEWRDARGRSIGEIEIEQADEPVVSESLTNQTESIGTAQHQDAADGREGN
jgi:hypothetical protein